MVLSVANYTQGDLEILRKMLVHPRTTASLSDAGGTIPVNSPDIAKRRNV